MTTQRKREIRNEKENIWSMLNIHMSRAYIFFFHVSIDINSVHRIPDVQNKFSETFLLYLYQQYSQCSPQKSKLLSNHNCLQQEQCPTYESVIMTVQICQVKMSRRQTYILHIPVTYQSVMSSKFQVYQIMCLYCIFTMFTVSSTNCGCGSTNNQMVQGIKTSCQCSQRPTLALNPVLFIATERPNGNKKEQ